MNATSTITAAPQATDRPSLELLASRFFPSWLAEQQISLAFSTYQAGKLFLVGRQSDGRLGVFERTFNRCMGLCGNSQTLWMSSQFQLWRLDNCLDADQSHENYDRLYVPRLGYTTGDIDIHDVAVDASGQVLFISTLFSCLATVSERWNFTPLWRPNFISKLAAEDRCHLNGLAMDEGQPKYVTACSQSDVADGWRDHRSDGGCVVDVDSGEIIATGLSMPHSPRIYRDQLWVLHSGTGEFGRIDVQAGTFEPIAFCPGYARGLAFVGDYAIVGLSNSRERTFTGLPLDDALTKRHAAQRCGLQVIELGTGQTTHWLRIEGAVTELYDIVVLPGVRRPKALGFKTEEIQHNVWFEADGRVTSWSGFKRE